MKRGLTVVLALLLPLSAMAGWLEDARSSVEQSMLVTGTISVGPTGHVSGYTLDKADKLPVGIRGLVGDSVLKWEFEPMQVDGLPASARNRMTLRVIARHLDDKQIRIRLSGVNFSPMVANDDARVTAKRAVPPRYPRAARKEGVAGTVYAAVKVGRDGKVLDTHVNQVDLRILGSESQLPRWRGLLGDAVTDAIKRWEFTAPAEGNEADSPHWSVMVPVAFSLTGTRRRGKTGHGEWEAYVPGPYTPAPWKITDVDSDGRSANALVDGGVYMASEQGRLRLLSPLGS